MFGVLIAVTMTLPASCEQRCAADADRCYANCRSSQKCSRHCSDRSADCNATCAKQEAKVRTEADGPPGSIPCGTKRGKDGSTQMRPCTEAEAKIYKDAFNSAEAQKALKCRDDKGRPSPCKEDLEKADQVVKAAGPDALCTDVDGKRVCPNAQEKVEKSLKR